MGKGKQNKKNNSTSLKKDDIINNRLNPTGVLTCQEIKDLGLINPINATNDDKNSLQLTTYDLRLGEFHYVSSDKDWVPTYIGKKNDKIYNQIKDAPLYVDNKLSEPGNVLTIPPFGKALIQLLEVVDTASVAEKGSLVVGHFDLKLSKVQKGLISQQATQVEPYYTGRLFCYLFNLSGQKIELKYEERIASIEFFYVSTYENDATLKKTKSDFLQTCINKYKDQTACDELGILDARYFAYNKSTEGRGLPYGAGLNEIYNNLQEKISEVKKFKNEFEKHLRRCDEITDKANEAKENANQAAKDAIKVADDIKIEHKHDKEQNKTNKLSIIAIIVAVILGVLSLVCSFGLNYGWFDGLVGVTRDPPDQPEQTEQIEKVEQVEQSVMNIEL